MNLNGKKELLLSPLPMQKKMQAHSGIGAIFQIQDYAASLSARRAWRLRSFGSR